MSNQPSTPVRVPSAAASYTPATLDPDLRSQINTLLLRDEHAAKIQEALLHALHAHPGNWPTAVQRHAVSLLRSGEVNNFPSLLRRILDDVQENTQATIAVAQSVNGTEANGRKVNGDSMQPLQSLALPQSVVDEALKIARESLESVCEIEENGAA